MYIASQVFGSPLALRYLRPDWVAPLGSSALVFNFIFARWLVGTPVTRLDVQGTVVIVLGVILIVVFSSINSGLDQSISIDRLNGLWIRLSWLLYLVLVFAGTWTIYLFSSLLRALLASRASYSAMTSPTLEPTATPRQPNKLITLAKRYWAAWKSIEKRLLAQVERLLSRADDARVTWLQGIGWAVTGGSLAGLCLVWTKAVVKIFWLPGHPVGDAIEKYDSTLKNAAAQPVFLDHPHSRHLHSSPADRLPQPSVAVHRHRCRCAALLRR